MNEFDKLMHDPVGRRVFLARMSAAGLGAAAATLLANHPVSAQTDAPATTGEASADPATATGFDPVNFPNIPGRNINEVVLNFALTLEILEADLYRQALNKATGKPLNTPLGAESSYNTLAIAPGTISPVAGALDPRAGEPITDGFTFLRQFTFIEAAHRDFLRAVLQSIGAPITQPNPGGYQFPGNNPGDDLRTILLNVFPLEEVGQRAYLGAAGFLTSLDLITAAASIHSTEARHAEAIANNLGFPPGPRKLPGDKQVTPNYPSENTFEYFIDPPTAIARAKRYFVQ